MPNHAQAARLEGATPVVDEILLQFQTLSSCPFMLIASLLSNSSYLPKKHTLYDHSRYFLSLRQCIELYYHS